MRAPECILTKEAVSALLEIVIARQVAVRIKRRADDADGVEEEWIIGSRMTGDWCHLFRHKCGDRVDVTFSFGKRGWLMEAVEQIVSAHPNCSWVYPENENGGEPGATGNSRHASQ